MNPAVQAILALTCVVVLAAVGFWFYQERQEAQTDPLIEFQESVDRVRELQRQID